MGEARPREPDRGVGLLAAGTLSAPEGPRQRLTRVAVMQQEEVEEEVGTLQLIAFVHAIDQ